MAKELPYFKFEPNQWENGNIQMCSRDDKGLFIDTCSMYWSRLGDLPLKLAIQKLCAGNATAYDSLCEEKIIEVIDGNIFIKFLSEQLEEFGDVSKKNSKNAKEGWEKRRKQKDLSDRNATASKSQSENDTIREDKRIEEEKKLINAENGFDSFWLLYPKKVEKDACRKIYAKLSITDKQKISETLSAFLSYKPFPDYNHPNPKTYLNKQRWNDEINTNQTKISINDERFRQAASAIRSADQTI